MNIIVNENQYESLILAEDENEAYQRKTSMAPNLKAIWAAIDRKTAYLEREVFGDLSDRIYDITAEKSAVMGDKFMHVPKTMFKAGNSKLPKGVLVVNMSSALMCPSYFMGLCHITKGSCYAMSDENRWTNNVLPQRRQTDLMYTQMLQQYEAGNKNPMKDYFSLVETYIQLGNAYSKNMYRQELERMENQLGRPLNPVELNFLEKQQSQWKITDVRLNETGDFHCQLAVDLWNEFAGKIKRKYGIKTHAYSARLLDFSKANNIAVNTSREGAKIGNEPQRKFIAVSDKEYNQLQGGDKVKNRQPILGKNEKGFFYKCPCSPSNAACDKCGICFDKNKTGKPYTIYVRYHGAQNANGLKHLFTPQEVKQVFGRLQQHGWMTPQEVGSFNNPDNQKALTRYGEKSLQKRSTEQPTSKKETKTKKQKRAAN